MLLLPSLTKLKTCLVKKRKLRWHYKKKAFCNMFSPVVTNLFEFFYLKVFFKLKGESFY